MARPLASHQARLGCPSLGPAHSVQRPRQAGGKVAWASAGQGPGKDGGGGAKEGPGPRTPRPRRPAGPAPGGAQLAHCGGARGGRGRPQAAGLGADLGRPNGDPTSAAAAPLTCSSRAWPRRCLRAAPACAPALGARPCVGPQRVRRPPPPAPIPPPGPPPSALGRAAPTLPVRADPTVPPARGAGATRRGERHGARRGGDGGHAGASRRGQGSTQGDGGRRGRGSTRGGRRGGARRGVGAGREPAEKGPAGPVTDTWTGGTTASGRRATWGVGPARSVEGPD